MSADITNGSDPDTTANTSTGGTPVKERHALTLDQRRALRRWANSQPIRPSHKHCIEWFQSQYNQTISQSTVSHSLSPKYARLDGDPQLSGSRLRFGNWPDVERLVLLWYQHSVSTGRHPSNEELAEKAKAIFQALPRYKDEQAPEFSPGWIHRFKKRYGLLIRRQRRHGSNGAPNLADDINYLVESVPRFMHVTPDISPTAIRDTVQRVVGVEANLSTCAMVRDEIIRRMENPQAAGPTGLTPLNGGLNGDGTGLGAFGDDDPEAVLQNALRQLQQEEADAEAEAAAVREERDRVDRGLPPNPGPPLGALAGQAYAQHAAAAVNAMSTPSRPTIPGVGNGPPRFGGTPGSAGQNGVNGATASEDLNLTPIPSTAPVSVTDKPVRCPFCLNQRMLRTIKEAVEHMTTHVVV